MKNFHSQSLNIFKSFSRTELQDFKNYLKSNFFNESKILCNLFNEVVKYYPDKLSTDILNKIKKKPAFKNKNYTEIQVREFAYRLNKKAQEFLTYNSFKNDPYIQDELLLNELLSRGQDNLFKKRFDGFMQSFKEKPKTINENHKDYLFKIMLLNYNVRNSSLLKHYEGKRKIKEIENCTYVLTKYYFLESVSSYVAFVIDSIGFSIDKNTSILSDIEIIDKIYEKLKNTNDKVIQLYFLLFKTFYNIDDVNFYSRYRDYFFEIYSDLNLEIQQLNFEYLYRYCTIKRSLRDDKLDYGIELYKLYQLYLKNKFYITSESRYIRTIMLINVIKLSAELKNFDLVNNFISENTSHINPKDKEIILSYSKAYEEFTNQNFDIALEEVNKIPMINYSYKYEVRMLTIRSMYEINSPELSIAHIKAYRKFLKGDKFLSEEVKLISLNFLNYLTHLIQKADGKNDLGYSLSKLKDETKICHKDWLIEKYENLLNN